MKVPYQIRIEPEQLAQLKQLASINDTSVNHEIRQAIKKIANENKEKQQHRLQRMIIRLQMFSWEKVAKQTVSVYKQAINDRLN